jgi:uncharacterized repeat protein (TIGR03943 family)
MTGYRPIVVLTFAAALMRVATSNRLLLYVRPTSRPYIVLAGLVLALIGAIGVVAPQQWLRDTRRSRAGWFVVAPIVTLVLVSPPQGGVAAPGHRPAPPPQPHTSLALPGPDPTSITVASVVQRAAWAPTSMKGHLLRILGFVASRNAGGFVLARLSITCCAADAQEDDLVVRLPATTAPPETGRWVTVTGRFAEMSSSDQFEPVVDATQVEFAAAPADPYD